MQGVPGGSRGVPGVWGGSRGVPRGGTFSRARSSSKSPWISRRQLSCREWKDSGGPSPAGSSPDSRRRMAPKPGRRWGSCSQQAAGAPRGPGGAPGEPQCPPWDAGAPTGDPGVPSRTQASGYPRTQEWGSPHPTQGPQDIQAPSTPPPQTQVSGYPRTQEWGSPSPTFPPRNPGVRVPPTPQKTQPPECPLGVRVPPRGPSAPLSPPGTNLPSAGRRAGGRWRGWAASVC